MKQLLTRLDDDLHARLKRRAAARGQSLNELVVTALAKTVEEPLTRESVRERIRAAGKLVEPKAPEHVLTHDEIIAANRGTGTSVSEALEADRGKW